MLHAHCSELDFCRMADKEISRLLEDGNLLTPEEPTILRMIEEFSHSGSGSGKNSNGLWL